MVVIRSDREGSNKAHPTLATPKRPRGRGEDQDAAETLKAEERGTLRRDEAQLVTDRESGNAARLTSLLHRAGVSDETARSTSSTAAREESAARDGAATRATTTTRESLATRDSAATRAVNNDAVVKATSKLEHVQLGPANAPRIELTPRLSESALSFAQNIDRAIGNHLVQTVAALNAANVTHVEVPTNARLQVTPHGEDGFLQQRGQRELATQQAIGQENERQLVREVPVLDEGAEERIDERGLERVVAQNTHDGTPGVTGNAHANANGERGATANRANGNLARADTRVAANARGLTTRDALANLGRTNALNTNALSLLEMGNLSSDQLLAEFLKLNINDPNANVETQNKLYDLATKMRQLAIEEAKKKIERAQEMMKEAQKYADQVQKYADAAAIVGIFAAFLGPLGAILSGLMQIAVAVAQYEAQMKILDAKEEKNNAARFTLMGDMHQNQVQETGEIINTIMELKNQMVESVIQMLNASFSTQQQLLSASMAR